MRVTMCYHGTPLHLECDRLDRRDDVIVEQQHCGGNPRTVYTGKLLPGGAINELILSPF